MNLPGLALLSIALGASGTSLLAQNFELRSVTIANGGGTSSGGRFVFSDTIGQQTTSPMNGGAYTFHGGFWNMVTIVQTPGAPGLSIRPVGNRQIVASWPSSATGFVLQEAASMSSPVVWTDVTTPVVVNGGDNTVTQPAGGAQRYYRLRQAGR